MPGSLFIPPSFIPIGVTGAPIAGAKLWVYRAGTSILADSYTTADLDTPHANPVIAGTLGFDPIYLDPDAGYDYKFVLQTAAGVQVRQWDAVPATGTGTGSGTGTGTPGTNGLSVAELTIYRRADVAPSTPTGGSYNFTTLTLTPPTDWSADIPSGSAPVYAARAVAAVEGNTGTDSILTWSAPARVLSDGSSVDIIFRRSSTQPATPAPSSDIPENWYTDVDSVPASSDKLWSCVGTRAHEGLNWVWQLPIQVEGDEGPTGPTGATGATGPTGPTGPGGADGASPTLYYIKPLSGTAIKNGTGSLTIEARKIENGVDSLLSSGDVKLYVGSTPVTVANGYATGSDGYTGVFDSGDIAGSVVVTLKVSGGTVRDSITLVDVADGTADTGKNAVFGYVEADGSLAWVRGTDGTTWTPSGTTRQLDCTFVQGGAEVARVAHVITRATDGTLTGAAGTHTGGDLNGSRVSVTEFGEGTQSMTVRFNYSNAGDESAASETVLSALSGTNGSTGATGPGGTSALTLRLTKTTFALDSYTNGTVVSFADATGYATVWSGTTDVTASSTLSATGSTGVTGTVNTSTDTPVLSEPKGYYRVTAMSQNTGTLTISATYGGDTVTQTVTIAKTFRGYEIVSSLPTTNLFAGRVVYLTTTDGVNQPNKLYRYTGSAWTASVPTVDLSGLVTGSQIAAATITGGNIAAGTLTASNILAGTITGDRIAAGTVTAANMSVTQLSALTANLGTVTAGVVQSSSGGFRMDATNARIIVNTAPGTTGGMVRVQGAGFGPAGAYLDWYGPKPPGESTDSGIISNLTDAAALYFLKTNGLSKSATQRIRGEFEVKAWANINADLTTPTIGDCFNIASVSKPAAGRTRITFVEPLANANYACATGAFDVTKDVVAMVYEQTTTYVEVRTVTRGQGTNIYPTRLNVIIFGSNVVGGSNATTPTGGTGGGTTGWGNAPSGYALP